MEQEGLKVLLNLGIFGAGLSLVMEFMKAKWHMSGLTTKIVTIVLSLAVGAFYWFFKDTSVWLATVGVLTSATTVWALFFNTGNRA